MMKRAITTWDEVPIMMDLVMAGRIVEKTPEQLRTMSREGRFPATKVGKEWRVRKDVLMDYTSPKHMVSAAAEVTE